MMSDALISAMKTRIYVFERHILRFKEKRNLLLKKADFLFTVIVNVAIYSYRILRVFKAQFMMKNNDIPVSINFFFWKLVFLFCISIGNEEF